MTTLNNYYVYAHQRLDDDSVFYIGKGHGKRAWDERGRSKHWKAIVKKAGYQVLILQEDMIETDAFTLERFLIVFYGRADLGEGRLLNMTDGGEGASGLVHSEDSRKKMSDAAKGRTHSEATRQKLSEAKKNISEATRQKISEAKKGKLFTEEHRKKLSEAGKGKTHSEATREKMSEAMKGKNRPPRSEEHRKKLSEAVSKNNKGCKWFNDGTKNLFIKPEDSLPHYNPGRFKKHKT